MSDEAPWPKVRVDYNQAMIIEIGSPCEFETLSSYEENIDEYMSNNYSYIPLPTDSRYYNVESGKMNELDDEQWVWPEDSVIPSLDLLLEYDFLLTYYPDGVFYADENGITKTNFRNIRQDESGQGYQMPNNLINDWPNYSDEIYEILNNSGDFRIITLADVNDRRLQAVLYQLISSVEVILSETIKSLDLDEEFLIKHMNIESVGRWKKAEYDAGQRHPVEYMYFGELKDIISRSDKLLNLLEYDLDEQYNSDLGGIKNLRDKVMHPTKNLVQDRNDLANLKDIVKKLEKFVERCGGEIYSHQ